MLPENIIYISLFTTLVGYSFYFRGIFYGQVRPNLVSWFLWMLGPFLGVFFQLKAGAGLSVLPVFLVGFGPLVMIIVSLFRKNVFWKITRLDVFCGILSVLALVFYILTHNLGVSILFAILSDGLAAVPTIIKSWKFPETELAVGYLPGIFNNILGLFIIKNWIFSIYSFSIYIIVINIIIIFCIYRKKIFQTKTTV
ncbi:hypothetical protein A3A05_02820 [Candidatus Nomurabacteria bacterium RIFCSPLOWO2_01_FULL_41_12]|uniref:Uncharacterized protein n=1 Tax=Candidatus Nomurabacteria bacterium RIFCSPLOWO2_01_FULL_41_12 TaxID=1801774 RepID=A0A1F6WX55_9BACT|nr:MAG: hypothetical protein A3A05_02820 [Candidatus Nomurabacteria bacterium RIFCSPLOWO2_01_FULL_41_12]